MQGDSLSGLRVLVTRPAHQAQVFCEMLEKQGAQAIRLPVIEIKPMNLSPEMMTLINQIEKIHCAIFISPNAVELGLAVLLAHGKIPDTLKLVTIGKASAVKMQQILGRAPDICPSEQYNSEALLALDSLQQPEVKDKNILIFRGQGGREFLADSLARRGANVDYIELYQRKIPDLKSEHLESIWGSRSLRHPNIITLTSKEGLNNLMAMINHAKVKNANDVLNDKYLKQILQTPLIVVTEKMRHSAQIIGFDQGIIVAAKASNEALLESVQEWFKIKSEC